MPVRECRLAAATIPSVPDKLATMRDCNAIFLDDLTSRGGNKYCMEHIVGLRAGRGGGLTSGRRDAERGLGYGAEDTTLAILDVVGSK